MDDYQFLKWAHIVSSTLLFGTGLGTAFHGWMAHRSGDARYAAAVGRSVVLADWLFTAPAVVVQPVTGVLLALTAGFPLTSSWLVAALILYALVGACWLPVVWLQIRLHRMAEQAAASGQALPPLFHRYARFWFLLGWPAFLGVLLIFWLMIAKPTLW
ncbi:DUF2269 domain-containing protein [Pseudoroseomonas cervicalis]|uniref:DUF2269 family protein n=1 Tax=Teichococcus cervicalis TaxID=204525 RepID=UPI0022F17DDB|nr:DUF2269 domain-containing protein [Pseudoroseomonas cervicalis]WBV44846.1 DUF2269 domain-containing protein [Pseudoroseomonas cervicalis]